MKKQIFKIALISSIVFGFFNTVYADTSVHLGVETDTGYIYNQNINVAPCDNEGTMAITAYYALSQSGVASDWSGLWVNSINGVVNNANSNGIYWMWLANLNTNDPYSDFACHQDAPYSCSAKQYILNPNDSILFYYSKNSTPPIFPSVSSGGPLLTDSPVGSGGGQLNDPPVVTTPAVVSTPPVSSPPILPPAPAKPIFDPKKAFDFLTAQQKEDGSFGEDLFTDWTAVALASGNYQDQTIKLIKYFGDSKLKNPSLTDYERRSMALMALGLNPYDTNGENYIEKIVTGFDSKQFGDPNQDNDDIFALIVLQNAGYGQNDKIINDDLNFVLSEQKEDGSWDSSVDMTGAAIEMLATFKDPLLEFGSQPKLAPLAGGGEIKNALAKAENFLKQNQKDNGSWGNSASSTAWVLEGILALNEKPEDWIKNDHTPLDYLATIQDIDGGVKDASISNKIWETAYVVSTLSGKTWNQIMQKFDKPLNPIIAKIPKKIIKIQNTASAISAFTNTPAASQPNSTPKKNWFQRLLDNIFRI
jgi:hypothetical protein